MTHAFCQYMYMRLNYRIHFFLFLLVFLFIYFFFIHRTICTSTMSAYTPTSHHLPSFCLQLLHLDLLDLSCVVRAGVSSPRSQPHSLPLVLTVVAGLDHFIQFFNVGPLLDIVSEVDARPTSAPPPFFLSLYNITH